MPSLPTRLLPFFWHFLREQRVGFCALMFCHLAWSIDWTVMPYFFKEFIDRVIGFTGDRQESWPVLLTPLLMGGGLWLLMSVMFRSYDFLSARVYPAFEASIRMRMFEYVSHHSHDYFSNHLAGEIAGKIDDMPQSATRVVQLMVTLFIPSFVALIISTVMFLNLYPVFALVIFSWFSTHIAICLVYAPECNRRSDIHSHQKNQITGNVVDCFSNMVTVRSFARRAFELGYVGKFQAQEQQDHRSILRLIFHIRLLLDLLCFSVMGVAMTWLMVDQWQRGLLTAGELSYVFYAGWGVVIMAWVSGIELPNFFKELGTCRQALRVIATPHALVDAPGATPLSVTRGEIRFEQVHFAYEHNEALFSDKNLVIDAGQKVGLVGFSGSGKTTFVHLILRFFDVSAGAIRIDGQSIATVTQDSLRASIAMIPQEASLFHRSLMDNIRYGRLDATDAEIIAAAEQAHCEEFIAQLPQGYATLVGERGIKLSGGQRQRIAIARAILKNAPILILDEATSALDSITEKHIQHSLKHLMQGRTTIVVAHRLSTLSEMDRILVFDKGRIVEDGTHEQLLTHGGHYARLWHMQAGGFLPEEAE